MDFCIPVQEGFYSDADSAPAVTTPGILLVVSSLGITIFYALGPGTYIQKFTDCVDIWHLIELLDFVLTYL